MTVVKVIREPATGVTMATLAAFFLIGILFGLAILQ